MTVVTIAIDVMSGDHGSSVTVPASLLAVKKHPETHFILVGNPDKITACLQKQGISQLPATLSIQAANQVVAMDESPSMALKNKKDASMRVAINLVKEQRASACVSAGNTGALMAMARFVLKMIPGVDRPAIVSTLPSLQAGKTVRMLDLGANVDSTPAHLLQFAVMGSVVASAVGGIKQPTVGLLNIGAEEIKGNEQVKEAAQLLAQHAALNYVGYVEGNDIFSGNTDVIVCDGFVGNVALKSSEGSANLMLHYVKQAFYRNWYSKLVAILAKPILKDVKRHVDPANYNGACLIGLRGIVIKSHGSAQIHGFANAISEAVFQAHQNIPALVHQQVADMLQPVQS